MSDQKLNYIDDVNGLIYDLALQACRKQVLVFSGELKKKMLSLGVSKAKTAEIIKEAFKGYTSMETFKNECSSFMYETLEAYLLPSRRQADGLGRLLVEYGINRANKRQMLFADGSDKDKATRKKFIKGLIARPLVLYFLVSVRGTLDSIDEFKAKPVLFGLENEVMAARKKDITELVTEFTVHYKYDKQSTDWSKLFADIRCKQIVFETLRDILESLQSMGPERYLKIINNIQNNNKFATERTTMKRLFVLNDIKQLIVALKRGYAKLEKELA